MSNIAIKSENISKAYQLGQIGTGTVSRDLERWFARIRGKEDPFLKIGELNNQKIKSESDVVWSLKDISFEIEQGDAVGIIGRNGAGKSTLLKILSKVTAPTSGKISGRGRIASLLEVGTGFHPELSGRENIFLNGAILGMRKKEIQRKLEEIVDFAGIERYLDTPVKRYSSGMYVRLAFAVAAHLESEILIVDEVLAVGDAEFQKKCLGKMGEVSKGEGRTVLFVSHNMSSIESLCNKGILLDKSKILFEGGIKQSINSYNSLLSQENYIDIETYFANNRNNNFLIKEILINQQSTAFINIKDKIISVELRAESFIEDLIDIELYLVDPVKNISILFGSLYYTHGKKISVKNGEVNIKFDVILPDNIFSGNYNLNIMITIPGKLFLYKIENRYTLNIKGADCESGKNYNLEDNFGYGELKIKDIHYKIW
ncbi:ABC transporter ATP-binding protein [Pedobacter nototheniae]|uniref:ABC transporter ATP-binding protein n=1 Tax=Pedobacter nototheniae TaxID=2488994 RepID=UPI00292D6813|nr:ABC transporter ATP-binding protein [Pedobacter nototheniae]